LREGYFENFGPPPVSRGEGYPAGRKVTIVRASRNGDLLRVTHGFSETP
jgi:hypothetical protein